MHPWVKGKIRGEPFSNDENKNVVEINFQEKRTKSIIRCFQKNTATRGNLKTSKSKMSFSISFLRECGIWIFKPSKE